MADDKSIVIDTQPLSLIIEDGDKFLFDPKAEEVLIKWKQFMKRVDEVNDIIKKKLLEQMTAMKCVKVEGDEVKVSRRFFGERFELTDRDAALNSGFATETRVVKANSKEIDRYAKDVGELPEGVALKDRTESIVITLTTEKEEA